MNFRVLVKAIFEKYGLFVLVSAISFSLLSSSSIAGISYLDGTSTPPMVNEVLEVPLNDTLPFLSQAMDLSQLNNTTELSLEIYLSIDISAATSYSQLVSNTSSSLFHKFLTPSEFMSKFGPMAGAISSVEDWLSSSGVKEMNFSNGREISFEETAGFVEQLLRITLINYELNGTYFYANSNDPIIPNNIVNEITTISGLNDYGAELVNNTPFVYTEWDQVYGGLPGQTVLTANPYDINPYFNITPLLQNGYDGKWITIGLIGYPDWRYYGTDPQNFWEHYNIKYTYNGQSYYPSDTQIIIGGGGLPPWGNNRASLEETLDVEWAGTIAPGATIDDVIYSAPSGGDTGFEYGFDQELSYMVNTLVPVVMSFSIAPTYNSISTSEVDNIHDFLAQATTEGITIVAATGDNGYSSSGNNIDMVALDPNSIAVGGVTLSLTSSDISGQSGWSGSGRGYVTNNPIFSQPSYQSGVAPNNGYRDIPDISFAAAPSIVVYFDGTFYGGVDGTSYATPMMAGIIADTYLNGTGDVYGFINKGIYSIGYSSGAYTDITTGNNGMSAGSGWDYVTGIGSVNAYNFVQALRNYYTSSGGGGGCVLNGTLIQTSLNKTIQVQDLKVGDQILSYDPIGGNFVEEEVTEINVTNVNSIINIDNGLLFVSGARDQPIYVKLSNGTVEWIMVGYLNTSDAIFDPLNNTWIQVTSIQMTNGNFTVYDIQGSKLFYQDGYLRSSYIANGILLDVKT